MNVIPPIAINSVSGVLTSTSASAEPASSETSWVSAGSYIVGDVRIVVAQHRKYQCLVSNSGRTTSPELDTSYWLDIGPTNKWAMFDTLRNSATTYAGNLVTVLTPGQSINSIAILQTNATSIIISATSVMGGGTVYNSTFSMFSRLTTGWYSYFFTSIETRPNLILFDLPTYSDLIVTVTQVGTTVTCGALILGTYFNLGYTQLGATVEALNFSSIDRDIYGNSNLVPRRSVPKTVQVIYIESDRVNSAIALRDSLNAIPAVWSGLNEENTHNYFEALLILGFYKTFTITMDNQFYSRIDLELEEV